MRAKTLLNLMFAAVAGMAAGSPVSVGAEEITLSADRWGRKVTIPRLVWRSADFRAPPKSGIPDTREPESGGCHLRVTVGGLDLSAEPALGCLLRGLAQGWIRHLPWAWVALDISSRGPTNSLPPLEPLPPTA